ncbi:hypothetical protein [Pseudomonas asplenii]|uniref:hypothetical protein n=1 Tax=Pseudomonas asplenii TaxID=53407 RepID=UPI0006B55E4D|nr:hypothetical protein [Pseudomonas fuscovaginae]
MNGADDSNEVSHKHFEDVRPVLLARWDDHDRSASSICLVGSTDPEQLDGLSSLLSQQLLQHSRSGSGFIMQGQKAPVNGFVVIFLSHYMLQIHHRWRFGQ